jgi:hypothetical protein
MYSTFFYEYWRRPILVNTYDEAIEFSKKTHTTRFMWGLFTPAEREQFLHQVLSPAAGGGGGADAADNAIVP